MKRKTWPSSHASIRRHIFAGVVIVGFLAIGVGGWASTAEISGALIAQGSIVVDSNVKKVQHPTGGVVGELRVRDGDRVKAGDILIRLDETVTRANLAIVTKGLTELYARKARLAPSATARRPSRRRRSSPHRPTIPRPRKRWPASASCSNCGARPGSAKRISCSSA
jgi:multidrug efflux pump subunit AcrA (membrane-fusion protein)